MTDEETAWLLNVDNQRKEDCVLKDLAEPDEDVVLPCYVHGEHFLKGKK